jgi:hypothetical protein
MKKTAILALAAAALASGAALAHGRVVFGIGIGVPIWGAPYYPYPYYPYYPYYYEPRTVIVPAQPTRYIEQSSPESGFWYYCADAKAYYPYVKDCPAGWQRVSPTPR